VGIARNDPFYIKKEAASMGRIAKGDIAYLLFSNQPFATKLANTLSAWVLVIGDVSAFTSRRAAREEMEYELFGASMICSTCIECRLQG
jgi:hypothetical protein